MDQLNKSKQDTNLCKPMDKDINSGDFHLESKEGEYSDNMTDQKKINADNAQIESKEGEDIDSMSEDSFQDSTEYESKEFEPMEVETEEFQNKDMGAAAGIESNDEDFPTEKPFLPTLYVVIDETGSVNLQEKAHEYGFNYIDFHRLDELKALQEESDDASLMRQVFLARSSRLSTDDIERLQRSFSVHFVVMELKIDQPPLVEKNREYINQLEKYFADNISISKIYVDHGDTPKAQNRLSTQSLTVVFDNPHLDILEVS